MKSLSPWRANAAVCAPAFIKARIIGQSCSVMVNIVTWVCDTAAILAELFQIAVCWRGDQLRKDKHESDPKKYSCRWVIQLMLISKKQK
jgi:hypothetical protein